MKIDILDDLVEKYDLNASLCPNRSRHWSNQIPSDMMFDHWAQFYSKRVAAKHFGMKYPELRTWGPTECDKFYRERMLDNEGQIIDLYKLDSSDSAVNVAFGTTTGEVLSVFAYRWDQGYSFLDYDERVQRGIELLGKKEAKRVAKAITELEELEAARDSLIENMEQVITSPQNAARLKGLLQNSKISFADLLDE